MKKTYTDAINPMEYTSGLNKHLRIPQIDTKTLQEIINKTRDMLIDGIERVNIVDLGCGPGRLTNKIARLLVNDNVKITGIDEDKKFIDAAKKGAKGMDNIEYINSKLPNLCPKAHIFLTYGVWHHLDRKSERGEWRDMIIKNLADKGSFFIGDEYISSYTNEKSRIINATQLYTNVIGDAYQIAGKKVDELVRIEIMNRIEDLHESGIGKGVVSDYCLSEVANRCLNLKLELEDIGYKNGYHQTKKLMEYITTLTEYSYSQDGLKCNSRGDYKISTEKQKNELNPLRLKNKYFSGNENAYGGMGLLEFTK